MAVSLEQFVENLVRSGLFTADELAAFQHGLPPERQPQKPQDLARELIQAGRLTKFQAAQVYQGKTKGLVLGDYVIQDQIGHGGMGQVFKAWRRDMERSVALKILPAKAMGSPDAVERFRREVKAAAKLLHPNIVTAFDAGEAGGTHSLVMEYVHGKDCAALAQVQFEEEDLAARVTAWRSGVELLADLKARIMNKTNGADPPPLSQKGQFLLFTGMRLSRTGRPQEDCLFRGASWTAV